MAKIEAVLNKAGWCSGSERFTGLCDAGLHQVHRRHHLPHEHHDNSPDGGLYTVRLANPGIHPL